MKLARQWIIIGLVYYLLRASIIIFPNWKNDTAFEKWVNIIQVLVAVFTGVVVVYSYTYNLRPVKWALYSQAVLFLLSNLNMYQKDETPNYQGLNMLSSVFSMIFTTMNVVYATMVNLNTFQNYCFSISVFMGTIVSLVISDFNLTEEMNYHTIQSLVLSCVFACFVAPSLPLETCGQTTDKLWSEFSGSATEAWPSTLDCGWWVQLQF